MKHRYFSFQRGFSLLEVMAVVVIIGIFSTVAIPVVMKYLQKSKSSEALLNLRKIYDGEISYYQEDITLASGLLADKQFVSFSATPSLPGRNKQTVDFSGWSIIKFSVDGPVLYSYSVIASGVNENSAFTARAEGDIDGDGERSRFERVANVDANGEVLGGGAVYQLDPTE